MFFNLDKLLHCNKKQRIVYQAFPFKKKCGHLFSCYFGFKFELS